MRTPVQSNILYIVAEVYNVSTRELLHTTARSGIPFHARAVAMVLLKRHTALNTTSLAKLFERDHSTITNALPRGKVFIRSTYEGQLAEQRVEELLGIRTVVDVPAPGQGAALTRIPRSASR